MGRGILLWLLGVPIPIIILLALFHHNSFAEESVLALNAPRTSRPIQHRSFQNVDPDNHSHHFGDRVVGRF